MATLNETPRSGRLHIGIFGKRNAGKSSLINVLTGHQTSIVADLPGTTTDPVYKSMEIHGLGACVLIDTAGFDDEGAVGNLRLEKTQQALSKADMAILLLSGDKWEQEKEWHTRIKKQDTPCLVAFAKADLPGTEGMVAQAEKKFGVPILQVSAHSSQGIEELREALLRLLPENWEGPSLLGGLIRQGETALLVMPQDIQAPKGRLILPQVQVLRSLIDRQCLALVTTAVNLGAALAALSAPPDLIITDSQVFGQVYTQKHASSRLTSFSILMAASKGELDLLVEGARALMKLGARSSVLIAEACTHAPLSEDIGREKIPALLRKRFGSSIQVKVVSGTDFPTDLASYDLIIHCGACMFNRKYMLSRQDKAKNQNIPMTNYGLALAWFSDILDKIALP